MDIFDLQTFVPFFVSEIIDDLAHLVDKTDSRIRNETRRVKLVETKSASCGEPLSDFCPNYSKPDINWMSFKTNQLTSITNDQGMGLMTWGLSKTGPLVNKVYRTLKAVTCTFFSFAFTCLNCKLCSVKTLLYLASYFFCIYNIGFSFFLFFKSK